MSAIWGIVDFDKSAIEENIMHAMHKPYEKYKIDRFDEIVDGGVYFACAHQHITVESVYEKLPVYKDGIFFTADVLLDNREELIEKLKLAGTVSDAEIIFAAYLKWGERFVEKLIGIFAVAIYDTAKDLLLLYTDHTASRCINYYYRGSRFIFSTIYEPVVNAVDLFAEDKPLGYNKKWLAACESNCSADIILFEGLTPFEGVFQVKCGNYIKIHNGQLSEIKYWNPLKTVSRIKFKTIDEYRKYYIDTFTEVVRSMLRSKDNTALMLSCGLDSTAVGSVAASLLAGENKNLYTYTSVPHPDFESDYDDYYITDESIGPAEMKKKYNNIISSVIDFREKDALTGMRDNIDFLEVPFKSAVNFPWLMEIYERSYEDNCKILLKGQYGNSTISYGAIMTYVWQMILSGHFIKAYRQLKLFKDKMHVSVKNILQVFCGQFTDKLCIDLSALDDSLLKDGEIEKYGVRQKLKKAYKYNGGSIMDSRSQWRNFVYAPETFQHLSIFDTKNGLKNGIIIRDPTKDKRIIELCLAFPIDCFVVDGTERALVRCFMSDYITEGILAIRNRRGLQGADFYFRMERNYERNISQFEKHLDNELVLRYLNKDRLVGLRRKLEDKESLSKKDYIQMLVVSSLACFFELYGERNID